MYFPLLHLRVQAQVFGHLPIARVLANLLATPDDDRSVRGSNRETLEDLVDVGIAFDIHIQEGVIVAPEKLTQAQRVGRVTRPDQHDVAMTGREYSHASQNECAHEQLAQLRVRLDDATQAFNIDGDDGASITNPDACETGTPTQCAQLAGEVPRCQQSHELVLGRGRGVYLEAARRHDKEMPRPLPNVHQNLPGMRLQALPKTLQARDLRLSELGKHLRAARLQDGIGHEQALVRAIRRSSCSSLPAAPAAGFDFLRTVFEGWRLAVFFFAVAIGTLLLSRCAPVL